MTTREENELLTRTGPGTPGGALLRHYWQPVGLSRDIADGPIAVRILSEDLVLFRDESGKPGLLGLYCPHRSADLSYGRVEDGGLRCLYHGWLFDTSGRCLEQPAEPVDSKYKDEVRHKAYPCREAAGAIFAYMGPGEPPLFPGFHFLGAPEAHVHQTKLYHACNYLQANEGNIDPAHLSYLHGVKKPLKGKGEQALRVQQAIIQDSRPKIDIERTRYGIRIYAQRRTDEGKRLVRITNYVFPNLGFFAGEGQRTGPGGYSVHWHVPIDDRSHWRYDFVYHAHTPLDKAHLREKVGAEIGPDYRPFRTAANRFKQDRAEQKSLSFAGLGTYFPAHDLFAVQSPGAIHDRTREHLATTDLAIVTARRMMLSGMEAIAEGKDPPFLLRSPNENVFNDIVVAALDLGEEEDPRQRCADLIRSGDHHGFAPR